MSKLFHISTPSSLELTFAVQHGFRLEVELRWVQFWGVGADGMRREGEGLGPRFSRTGSFSTDGTGGNVLLLCTGNSWSDLNEQTDTHNNKHYQIFINITALQWITLSQVLCQTWASLNVKGIVHPKIFFLSSFTHSNASSSIQTYMHFFLLLNTNSDSKWVLFPIDFHFIFSPFDESQWQPKLFSLRYLLCSTEERKP